MDINVCYRKPQSHNGHCKQLVLSPKQEWPLKSEQHTAVPWASLMRKSKAPLYDPLQWITQQKSVDHTTMHPSYLSHLQPTSLNTDYQLALPLLQKPQIPGRE